jgi:hypothetical protein
MCRRVSLLAAGLLALGPSACTSSPSPSTAVPAADAQTGSTGPGETFATPEAAMLAVGAVASTGDRQRAESIFGAGSLVMLESGDEAADRENGQRVAEMIEEQLAFEDIGPGRKASLIGKSAWRFSIPLVQADGGWRFDLDAGKDELLNRRIGRNELFAIETLRACIDAQQEYRSLGPDGHQSGYARRFRSTAGKRDGLYWPPAAGGPRSPVGEFLADASVDDSPPKSATTPLHGYCYRILSCQGKTAPGGERSFLDREGHMTGGCGVLTWPANYGNSGIMTFMVNHVGIVFQKDLGPATAEAASKIISFDPDQTWTPVRE